MGAGRQELHLLTATFLSGVCQCGPLIYPIKDEPQAHVRIFVNFGQQLRNQRKSARFTQSELAERVGTTQAVISRYERGERDPTVEMLQRIADALDCELVIEFRPRGRHTE